MERPLSCRSSRCWRLNLAWGNTVLRALGDVAGGRQCRQVRGLDWIAMCALEKEPARRYQSAGELADDVERYLAGKPVLASRPSLLGRLRKWLRF